MVSRLLSALDARIARTRDPLQNDCLRAERATLLARQGRLDEARAELDRIRARHAAKPNAVVTAWVCLGEGMVVYYGDLGRSARDKFLRAHALGSAAGDSAVRCLSAAWLAHFDYLNQDFDAMVRLVEIALEEAMPDDHLTHERTALVVAQAYHWANQYDLARPWYARARWHSTNFGDETLLSALMHNMVWLHVAEARRRSLLEISDGRDVGQVLLGVDATQSFDQRVGTASLRTLVPMLRAHVLSLLQRHAEALELFEANLQGSLSEGLARIECSILAEIAWCQASVGRLAQARETARVAQLRIGECHQADERAAANGRLAQTLRALNDVEEARMHESQAKLAWERHSAAQSSLMTLLTNSTAVQSCIQANSIR
jgi:tetratricopeptide (TPR) repeat protein